MLLTYKNYVITGTAQELKEFIDLMENKVIISSTLQDLPNFPSDASITTTGKGPITKCSYPNNVCENH